MRNKMKRLMISLCVMIVFSASISAVASTVSVTIYTNDDYADSQTLGCTFLIDFYGINSSESSRNLYCELYEDTWGIDPQFFSIALVPGTGSMTGPTWYRILYQYSLDEAKLLYVHLDPAGGNSTGCYGAGKLVD